MIEILFWVLLVLFILQPWPGAPWASWPWGSVLIPFLLFVVLGLAVFGVGFHTRGW